MPKRSEGDETRTATTGRAALPRRHAGTFLLVVRGAEGTHVLEATEGASIVVGRADDAQVRVVDDRVSRHHARVDVRRGSVFVSDLGSRNGTWIGDELVRGEERAVAPGTVVRVAGCEIVVATASARGTATSQEADDGVVVADPATASAMELARKAARSKATVLLQGETGAGKEIFARRIHAWSPRSKGPFVAVSCAAIPDGLVESELFGHERGAFTGADRRKEGTFETANGGTLFLDEVGELSPPAQAKLLRVLETRAVQRLGSPREVPIDVRLVCATHRDLQGSVADGSFRADLYYRLAGVVVRIPPLRERPREIAALAHHFARQLSGGAEVTFDLGAIAALEAHRWPGNVRELRNAIEHALVVAEGAPIAAEHLPDAVRSLAPPAAARPSGASLPAGGVRSEIAEMERRRIEEALRACGGNQTKAAAMLQIPRRTLVWKIARWKKDA